MKKCMDKLLLVITGREMNILEKIRHNQIVFAKKEIKRQEKQLKDSKKRLKELLLKTN